MTRRIARIAIPAILGACLTSAHAQPSAEIEFDTPRAGWRSAKGEGANFTQTVNYPASSVNVSDDQSDAARIRGRIANADPKLPARLIVNGTAMPLKLDDTGNFDRPYAFPAGSNSVEVRGSDGRTARAVQFFAGGESDVPARLRVLLAWDSDHTDLDLHIVTPDGEHAWYGNRVLANGGAIDVDVTTGYGPEIFASPTPLHGRYLVYVNYYGGGYGSDSGDPAQALTTASISVIAQEGTPNEKQQTFIVPMRTTGELTLVTQFSYP